MRVAVGVGCRLGCEAGAIEAVVRRALAAVEGEVMGLFTIADKAGEAGLVEVAGRLGVGLVPVSRELLRAQSGVSRSAAVERRFGVASVAEAAALAGAGEGAWLMVPRVVGAGGYLCDCDLRGCGVRGVTVHFIGAGPGAADLITVRGRDLIAACPVCLYAGSLVPEALLAHCPAGARRIDTAALSLDEIVDACVAATGRGEDVARLQSGDLSVWSALGEQARRLEGLGIPFTVTPGVPSFAAAAAVLAQELTLPGVAQSVVLTRVEGRASAMPAGESLSAFAVTGATLAVHLSIQSLGRVVAALLPFYGADCPVAVVYRASWPDERVVVGDLGGIEGLLAGSIERSAVILVGRVLGSRAFRESALYSADYVRRFR